MESESHVAAHFFVAGTPIPKGSARALVFYGGKERCPTCREKSKPYARVFNDNRKTAPWEYAIQETIKAKRLGPFEPDSEHAFLLGMMFIMPRPAAHFKSSGQIKEWARELPHIGRPDVDKCARAAQDSLAGIFCKNDSQVVGYLHLQKRYAAEGEVSGVWITVRDARAP